MSNNDATFEGIPAELRGTIYELAFSNDRESQVSILSHRRAVPNSGSLRSTSKFILNETYSAYTKARAFLATQRKDLITSLVEAWEVRLEDNEELEDDSDRTHDYKPVHQIETLVENLKNDNVNASKARCDNHHCSIPNCYMCDDKAHQACFECGRNGALALYCKLNRKETPKMIEPNTDGRQNDHPIAKLMATLPSTHSRHFVMDPETNTSKCLQAWAFLYWQSRFKGERAVDIRCCIRKRAASRLFEMFGDSGDDDQDSKEIIAGFEDGDKMMGAWKHAKETVTKRDRKWRPEYSKRLAQWRENGCSPALV